MSDHHATTPPRVRCQLLVVLVVGVSDEATNEKVLLALLPRVVIAEIQTTMMRASITAYSTAVGPSSAFRNPTARLVIARIVASPGERM